MEVTPVIVDGAPKLADGKPVYMVDGKEQALDLADLLDTKGKYGTVSERADRLAREAGEARQIAESYKPFGDAKALADRLSKLRSLEDDLAAGKLGKPSKEFDEEVERRWGRTRVELEGAAQTNAELAERYKTDAKTKAELLRTRAIHGDLGMALSKEPDFSGTDGAIYAFSRRAEEEWDEEKGAAIRYQKPHDPSSGPVLGADARPLTMSEWVRGLRADGWAGSFFRAKADGGGANGNNGHAPGAKTMTRKEFEALPADEQSKRSIAGWTLTDPT